MQWHNNLIRTVNFTGALDLKLRLNPLGHFDFSSPLGVSLDQVSSNLISISFDAILNNIHDLKLFYQVSEPEKHF